MSKYGNRKLYRAKNTYTHTLLFSCDKCEAIRNNMKMVQRFKLLPLAKLFHASVYRCVLNNKQAHQINVVWTANFVDNCRLQIEYALDESAPIKCQSTYCISRTKPKIQFCLEINRISSDQAHEIPI